jgi:hypothetical protein
MSELVALSRKSPDRHYAVKAGEALSVLKRIVQTERDQKADEDRIDAAITRAETEIAALEQRSLAPEEFDRAITAVRDRAVLIIRDVRKNMRKRTVAAKNTQETLSDDFLRRGSRFAKDDLEDANLRTRFFKLLERTPTFALIDHLQDAVEADNIACAESIRFEFQCRDDRHEYMASFERIVAKLALHDPIAMRKRLTNICNAAEKIDERIADLLQRVRSARNLNSALARADMPIYRLLKDQAFGPDEIEVLSGAFEDALITLQLVNRTDPATGLVAQRIIDLAKTGERDPARLREQVIQSLG